MQSEPRLLTREGGLWVVDKPVGWVAHAAHRSETRDVQAWLRGAGAPRDIAPLHRIDRGTSGVLLYGRPGPDKDAWLTAFAEGEVHKTYLALVIGKPRAKGTINRALDDGRRGHPLEARTRYRLVEKLGGFALLEVRPDTGRKHQIRRHLQQLGHPIVGDERYKPRRFVRVPAFPGRLWLHAQRLERDGQVFESPLPEALVAHLEVLRAGLRTSDAAG